MPESSLRGARRLGRPALLCARVAPLLLVLVALAASLAACATLDPLQRKQSFEESHKLFTQYLRWGKITQASSYVDPELRADFLSLAPELTEMRFTDYEIVSADIDDKWGSAVVDVRISGYRLSSPIEHTHEFTEEWRREGLTWLVRLDVDALRAALNPGRP